MCLNVIQEIGLILFGCLVYCVFIYILKLEIFLDFAEIIISLVMKHNELTSNYYEILYFLFQTMTFNTKMDGTFYSLFCFTDLEIE